MERLRPAAEGTIVASHIEAGGLLLPRGQLFWVDGVDASGNVEVEAEVEWLRDVDGFEIVARSRSELSHRVEVPAGYSCQFGGYQGTTSYISQNRKAGAPTTDSAIWIPFKLHRRYRLTFVVENGEAALLVDGVDRLRLRSLLPLGDHSYRKVGIRIWTDVIVHRLTVRRQQLPQKPSPLLAGDALVAAGHYRDAVQRYQEVASDFPRSKIAELALARGYLTALLDEGAEHDAEALLERLLQEYPASPHRQRCEEAAVAASWRAGRRQEALARAQRVLARYPDSRVAVPLMTPSGQRLERDAARPLLELLSRTLQLSRINLTGMDIEDLSPLKGREFVHLLLPHTAVKDLSPLRGMQLKLLDIAHTSIDSLEPLRGMPLESLSIEGTLVKDLGPLRGMPLVSLTVTGSRVTDLTPLSKMRLTSFLAGFQQLESLEPLRDMPLRRVHLQRTGVASLEPLSAAPLTDLYASGNRITDIGVLAGKPLSSLALARNRIKDISPLSGISGNYLDLSHNEIRDLSPLAGSRWHELSVGSNPVKDISPLAGTAARLFIADLPPQRVAALTQENLSFLEFNGTKILDPDELRGFSALAQLRLVGSVAPEILDELALAYEKRKRARALVRNLRVQAAYARRDVAALRALAGSMGGISALMLPFETDLDTARRVAQELGGRLPMLRDAIERELVEAELSPSEDVWLDAAFRDGSIRWADQTPIGEPPLPFDRAVVARQGGGLSWLRVGQHCTWGAIPKDHPEWQAAPLVIWRADGAARAEMGGASTSER
jgi:Leucine-rich repeat (LRR) protein